MTLQEAISRDELLFSDGGMGTELQKLGLEMNTCGDAWCLEHPDRVAQVHHAYVEAGSRLISTNTFSSNRFALEKHGLADKQAEIARAGARIAKEVIAGKGWVLGSVGPCGELLEPVGTLKPEDLRASLRVQIGALLEGGADAILLETQSGLDEVRLGLEVAHELNAPFVIVTGAFDPTKSGPRTMMGARPEQLAKVALEGGANVVGANCGRLAQEADFLLLLERLHAASGLPLMLQPNAGQPDAQGSEIVYHCGPEALAALMAPIAKHVKILGGCCGSTPAHIGAMKTRLGSAQSSAS
jgi:5-methyltetrahydrofolate--homocysteine methyltransferase